MHFLQQKTLHDGLSRLLIAFSPRLDSTDTPNQLVTCAATLDLILRCYRCHHSDGVIASLLSVALGCICKSIRVNVFNVIKSSHINGQSQN